MKLSPIPVFPTRAAAAFTFIVAIIPRTNLAPSSIMKLSCIPMSCNAHPMFIDRKVNISITGIACSPCMNQWAPLSSCDKKNSSTIPSISASIIDGNITKPVVSAPVTIKRITR